jgi:hypothetical protein
VQPFKFKTNGGRSEIKRGVNGNINFKTKCQGWCQFVKTAREYESELMIMNTDDVAIFFNADNHISRATDHAWYPLGEILPHNSCVVAVKSDCMDFQVSTMAKPMFSQKGDTLGAQNSF